MALPHTDVTREWDFCAYTGKCKRLSAMLAMHGHEAVVYASAPSDVPIVTDADRDRWFGGPWDRDRVFDRWEPEDPCWVEMNAAAISAIRDRFAPGDAIGIIAGRCQAAIADAFAGQLILEWGVGYEGILPQSHRAFESEAWRHYVYGTVGQADGRFFDTAIPNAFDPDDYLVRADHDGYVLYLGRPTERKGLAVVRDVARRHRVITAGQGPAWCPNAEHVGIVLGDEKAKLLAGAQAVLVPTFYIEPFGGVAVEAMMSGAPAITTDFGAFTETVDHGSTGFRCSTLGEFHAAVDQAADMDRTHIAAVARARYSTGAVASLYDAWLRRCDLLHGDGWYGG